MGNKTFRILSCIGILLIILGHLNCNLLEFGGLFPYYSYHVMVFVFISGYFYKVEDEQNIGGFVLRKMKKLIVPYLMLNVLFGIVVWGLHKLGFAYGGDMNLETLVVSPFADGHQFGLNAPGWFIPALFLFEICNVLGRFVLNKIKAENEYLIMVLYLAMGMLCIAMSMRGMVYDYYRIPARIMFMAPVFQAGRLYKTKLEKYDTLNSVIYFALVIGIGAVLHFAPVGGLAYSAAWVNGFSNIFIPYVTTFMGIALWLRVSKLLSGLWKENVIFNFVEYMGKNTFAICIFHLSAFLAVNAVLKYAGVDGFNAEEFNWNVYYAFSGWGNGFKLVYAVIGIAAPLGLCRCWEFVKEIACNLPKKRQ